MIALIEQSGRVLGRRAARLAATAVAAGALAVLVAWPSGAARTAVAALVACWLFFTALAAGSVALSAVARTAQGTWADPVAEALEGGTAWFPAAWVLLAALLAAGPLWMPHLGAEEHPTWLALASRSLIGVGLLFVVGTRFARASRAGRWDPATGTLGIVYLLLYVLVVSMWTVDLVMELGSGEPSAIVPAQAFIAALLSAIAWAALLCSAGAVETKLRHDLGKMLFGFSSFWAYFVWCSFLPVWYANLPSETGELIDRTSEGWDVISLGIIAACFVFPFALLLPEQVKKRPALLGLGSVSVLIGLGAERFLLVLRPLRIPVTPANLLFAAAIAAGATGLFALLVSARLPLRPAETGSGADGAHAPVVPRAV